MSVTPIGKDDVFAIAPQLGGGTDSDAWLDILAYANTVIVDSTSDIDTRMARIFLAAHIGQLKKNAGTGAAGPVTSTSVGGVRRSYGLIAQATSSAGLSTTRYGQMYLDILASSMCDLPMLV